MKRIREDEVTDNFGKLAFGGSEYIAKLQGKSKTEPDTELEAEVINAIKKWIIKSGTLSANKIHAHRELLQKAAKRFPKVLKPKTPNGTELFRGIKNIQNKTLLQIMNSNKNEWKVYASISGMRWWKHDFLTVSYSPHKNIQSWTDDIWVAVDFSDVRYDGWKTRESVILTTRQNDEFLFNQELIRILSPISYEYEKEVLHIGKTYTNPINLLINEVAYLTMVTKTESYKKAHDKFHGDLMTPHIEPKEKKNDK